MPSLQSQLIKTVFRLRRIITPPAGVLDVEKERAETEALAAKFKTRLQAIYTPTEVNHIPAEWIIPPGTSTGRAILYFHGGSYNSGSIYSHRSLATNIAQSAQALRRC